MKIHTIIVNGEPQGKGRPRFARRGIYTTTYTPEKTILYENEIKAAYLLKYGNEGFFNGEPLSVRIDAFCGVPKSASKAKRAAMLNGEIKPTKKPDVDNIAKVVLDALNGYAYKDDTQVAELVMRKHYAVTPGLLIEIS